MPVLHIVCACVCVSTLWDVGLTSDQAVTSSLLKLAMNYFLQSFPFLLIERRTVVSHWQNPTPGPFVSIRWEQLGVISLLLVYQWSNVRHGIFRSLFKEVHQRTNFSQITYKASPGMEGERLHVFFGLTGICIDL